MQCNIGDIKCCIHQSQKVQLICLSCNMNSLACPLCLDTIHHKHEVVSLKKFVTQQIPKLYEQKPDKELVAKKVNQLSSVFKQQIQIMRKQIGHQINQLQISYINSEQKLKSQLDFICGQITEKNLYQNIESAKAKILRKEKIINNVQIQQSFKQIQKKMIEFIAGTCMQIRRAIYRLKSIQYEFESLFMGSKTRSKFQFAQQYSHSSILIKNDKQYAINQKFDNVYHTCVAVPALNPFKNQITFQIKKSEHKCVWIGLADLQGVKQLKFQNTYKSQVPNYWIWQAGGDQEAQLYTHKSSLHPFIGWNFDLGDRVTMKLSFQKKKKILTFIKNKGRFFQQSLSYSFQVQSSYNVYYACISLGDQQQTLAIVNQ